MAGAMRGYAQQGLFASIKGSIQLFILLFSIDAEECYGQVLNSLRNVPGIGPNGPGNVDGKKFVDQYLMGEMRRE